MVQSAASIARAAREEEARRQSGEPVRRAAADSLYVAQGNPRSPQAQALAEAAGQRLGLPAALVDDAAIAQARLKEQMDALSKAHRTAGWISDPNNAAVASDQVEQLTGLEGFLANWRGQIKQNVDVNLLGARRVGAGAFEAIGGGLYGVGLTGERVLDRLGLADSAATAAQSGVPGLALAGLPSFLREVGDRNRRAAAYLRGEKGSERALSSGVPDFLPRSNIDLGFSGDVAEGVGQIGGQVAVAVGTGGFGSLPSMWGQGVSQMDDRVKADQKKDGRTQNSLADDLTLAGGGFVTAITEKLGLDAIMGALPAPVRARLTNKLADVAVAGFTEGTSEVLEGVGQNALAMTLLGEDTGLLDGDLTYQGGVGATVGAVARSLFMTAIPGRQHLASNQQADRALQEGERFDAVVQTVRQSELAKRSPERFASFLQSVTDPDAEVVIPAEAVSTFFQDNPDLDGWMDEWDIRAQVEEAKAAGTDVVMSQAAYLEKVAPTAAHDAWAPDIRFGLGEMSRREAEAFRTDGEATLSAALDTAVETAQSQEDAVTPERQVRDSLFSQLREAGYTADAANTQATLAARAFARRAERSPERFADAQAAYDAAGLRVEQEFPDVVRQSMDRLDVMVEALRRRSARPSDRRLFGRSMMEFLAQRGGVIDTGGELAALGVDSWHRPSQGGKAFRRRFTRNAEMGGAEFAPDLAAQAAVEAGYLPEGAGPNELFAAVRDELAGRPAYSQQFEADLQSQENADALDELERLMGDLGLTTDDDVSVIRERLERAAASDFPGDTNFVSDAAYNQSASGESLSDIISDAGSRGVKLSVSDPRDGLSVLSMIDTREAGQGQGVGTEIMNRLTAWADRSDVKLALTPEKVGNTSKARLTAFYKRHGFVENKGKAKDFATREAMVREPQSVGGLTEDQYIERINPDGGRISENHRPNLGMGDMYGMAPKGARQIATMQDTELGRVRIVESGGDVYALANNPDLGEEDVVGYMMARGDETTELAVVNEAKGKGIGAELSYQFRSRNPFAQSGGLTEAGEATARGAYRRMTQDGRVLFQSTPYTGPRGQISFGQGRATIKLFQSRDLSTFFHEFGHLTLEMLRDDAADPNASDQVKADLQIVLDWFSREAGRTITAADIGVEQHELWARGNEKYLMEGKAPSLELREVFRTVMAWLKNIYGAVLMINAPITDDVRGVMDRLLASDAEIAQARDAAGQALGADAYRQLGATDAEAAAYERQLARARSDAESDLLAQVMRAIRRVRTKEWNEAADEIRAEITAEVDAMPDIAALEFMKTTRTPMDRETAVAMLGDEAGLTLLPKRVPPIVAATGGAHPDMIAEAAGYRSGQAMLNGLMEMEAEKRAMVADGDDRSVRKARIENRIREALLDRYGDPMNDGSIEREALDAIHSERYGEVLALDLNLLARRTGNAPAPIDALRAWAKDRIGSRPVREARPGRYLRAERTASTAVQRALAAGDRDEAFRQKQAQAINNVLYVEAGRAERFADGALARMRCLGRGRNPSIHVDYMEQIDAILEQYELKAVSGRMVARRQSLAAFVQAQIEAGEPINIPAEVIDATRKTNLADLTVDELRGLDAAIKNLVHLGRLKTTLILNGERRELDRLADEAWATAQALPDVRADEAPGDKSAWENITGWGARMEASLVKAQEYFRLLDGGDRSGVFHEALDRPGQASADQRVALQDAFWTPVLDAKKAVSDKIQATWLDVVEDHPFINPNTGQPIQSLKRRDLLGAALHVGTLSNFEKMAKGYGLVSKEADALAVSAARIGFIGWLNERLDASEWAYVQAMWDAHERLRPDYFAAARKVEGGEPDAVEAEVVNTPAGPLKGGYAPIAYHPSYDQAAQAREQRDAASMFGDVMSAGPRPDNGSTNTRTTYVGPVKLGLDDARYQAERHITYAAYAEYITNSLKFIRHPLIASTIKRKLGLAAFNTFEPWLAGQVRDETVTDPGANPILQLAKGIRTNMTAAILMGSATVLLAQPGGLAQASVHLGPKWMAKGVGHAVGLGSTGNLRGFITERSEFMRLRVEQGDLDRDYRLAMQQARGAEGLKAQALTLTGKAIAMVDFYTVSGATWMGAYDKALSEGRDESQAVYLADMAVRVTQGGGRAIDQAGIQRANEVTKMMTFAYGWANAFYNMQRAAVVDLKNGQDRTENAIRLTALLLLPALLDAALSGDWPKEGDTVEETIKNVAAWFARNVFFGAAAGVPLLRDFAGTGERLAAGQYAGPVGQTPYGRLGDSVFRLGNDAWVAAFEPDKDVSRRWPAHLIQATGLALGIPGTTQAARAVNYITDVNDGEQNPDGVLDWMNGLLRGPQKDQEQ